MAANLPLLLRLPPCLRQQLLSRETSIQHLLQRRIPSNTVSTRSFTSHARLAQQKSAPPKPRVLKPDTNSLNVAPPNQTGSPANSSKIQPPPAPKTPPKAQFVKEPPKPQAKLPARPSNSPQFNDAFAARYGNEASILLYVAPKHRAFQILSFISGGIILFGAWNYAQVFLKDEPEKDLYKPWYLKTLGGISVLFMTVFATSIVLGPTKLIKSVSIVQQAAGSQAGVQAPRFLRIEVKRNLPFVKADVVECPTSHVAVDKEVRSMQTAIPMHRIPKQDAQSFTEAYKSGQLEEEGSQKGVRGVISSINSGFLNLWPALKKEVRRMCLRENMAYVAIRNNGTYKLDLGDCFILDDGRPLAQLFALNPDARTSIRARLTALFRR